MACPIAGTTCSELDGFCHCGDGGPVCGDGQVCEMALLVVAADLMRYLRRVGDALRLYGVATWFDPSLVRTD